MCTAMRDNTFHREHVPHCVLSLGGGSVSHLSFSSFLVNMSVSFTVNFLGFVFAFTEIGTISKISQGIHFCPKLCILGSHKTLTLRKLEDKLLDTCLFDARCLISIYWKNILYVDRLWRLKKRITYSGPTSLKTRVKILLVFWKNLSEK